jgi:hypothetical protein
MTRWTTQDILSILHEHLHIYATDKKGRKQTIVQAKQAILALATKQMIEPPSDLDKASCHMLLLILLLSSTNTLD